MTERDSLVIVFAGSVFDATLAKNLLESAQIESFLLDEQMGRLIPVYISAFGAGAVKVAVRPSDAEESREVLSAAAESPPVVDGTWECPNCGEVLEAQFGACWSCQTARPDKEQS